MRDESLKVRIVAECAIRLRDVRTNKWVMMDFTKTSIRMDRKITSYSKIQNLVTRIMRNRSFQATRPDVQAARYLDLGCGPNGHAGFVNADFNWLPGVNLCWDITRRLPFEDHRFEGVFTEHCLEHLPVKTAESVLRECKRLMRPGSTIRIVVPDAELYLTVYVRRLNGEDVAFPYDGQIQYEGITSPVLDVNRIFYQDRESPYGHWFIYDFAFLRQLLERVGFSDITRCAFGVGRNADLVADTPSRAVESLYAEARA
jgi:predicted SAM-dependent methyltransferase